jgi:hypothetical protein
MAKLEDALKKSYEQQVNGNQSSINQGFVVNSSPTADGNGLPYTKINNEKDGTFKRNLIHWFIPEFGVVKMFVNPQSIHYRYKKLISQERTKGGFNLQYWGEDLPGLDIVGNTGSSGVEGINVLYQVYRAEQYAFDSVGLTLAANNANNAQGVFNGMTDLLGLNKTAASTVGSVLGISSTNIGTQNLPTLAQVAFGVEMYYGGWVFRGYFDSFDFTESTDFLWTYNMRFIVTQQRGYRGNYFPFHHSANNGGSRYDTPYSFSGKVK